MNKRTWSRVFLMAALMLMAASAWFARHQLTVLTHWKTTEGTLMRRELVRNHDWNGYLLFQIEALFRYTADGKEEMVSTLSYFDASSFAQIAGKMTEYPAQAGYTLRYNPAKPEEFEFGAGFNALYFRRPLQFLAAAAACLLLGLLLVWTSRTPRRCQSCRQLLQSFFRYCPECGESISAA
jgi:hypothetical protein